MHGNHNSFDSHPEGRRRGHGGGANCRPRCSVADSSAGDTGNQTPGRHHGGGRDGRGSHNGSRGRGRRLFKRGALRLLTLSLLAERPRHGYEVIKAIEHMVGGEYSPSPGVIYPTLTYLADLGLATDTELEGGRKQYAITPAGQTELESQRVELDNLLARLGTRRQQADARGAPEIQRAMGNLRLALQLRFAQGAPDKALTQQVAMLIDQAAVGIERL